MTGLRTGAIITFIVDNWFITMTDNQIKNIKEVWVKDGSNINSYIKEDFIHNNDLMIK